MWEEGFVKTDRHKKTKYQEVSFLTNIERRSLRLRPLSLILFPTGWFKEADGAGS